MITICIPTLNRYDLLLKCIKSCEKGTLKPDKYVIIDNGQKFTENYSLPIKNAVIISFGENIGLANSWNWFIQNIPDTKIICNDDIEFSTNTVQIFADSLEENFILTPKSISGSNAFSCFSIPKKISDSVGDFDPTISPAYAYYEDNDYFKRMRTKGFDLKSIDTDVSHLGSSTLKMYDDIETNYHHYKFNMATNNYIKKWGGLPNHETFNIPYNINFNQ